MHNKYLIVIVGPTAVGKTALCVRLAAQFHTEIISADSRQFYHEMRIGTAKPNVEEMMGVKHYFVDDRSIKHEYNAGQFEKDALKIIHEIHESKDIAFITGGSGLYIDAVCEGIDDIPSSPELREELITQLEEHGLGKLTEELKKSDPDYYQLVDLNNSHRVIRALEVTRLTGQTYSGFRKKNNISRPFTVLKIGLDRPREELYHRIDLRMDIMINEGLFDEAKKLYPYKSHNALKTVGYKEIFDYMDGQYDKEEAIRLLKRNSRRYAKRQLTWFRKDAGIHWHHPDDIDKIIELINDKISV